MRVYCANCLLYYEMSHTMLDQSNRSTKPHGCRGADAPEPPGEGRGYFPPDSVIGRVDREALVLLGGGCSILLQLAHPFVAAGVDEHSNFQSEILDRLYRTLLFMHNLIVADRRAVQQSVRRFHAMHERVRGRLPHAAGRFPAGTPYSGRDPQTKLWVHATFVDTGLRVYEQFVPPLTPEERRRYYADTQLLGQVMGIPADILPQTLDEFQAYMDDMLTGDTLAVTDTARRLARAVLYPEVGILPTLSAGLLRFVTAGILPAPMRRAYGLPWGQRQQFLLNGLTRSTRGLRPLVPAWVWQHPLLGGRLTRVVLWGMRSSYT